MPFVEDPEEFLDKDSGFAEDVVIGTTPVTGHFATQYVDSLEVEGVSPTFLAPTADLNAAAIGATIAHGDVVNRVGEGVLYVVRSIQPEETGVWTLLILEAN